MLKRYIVFGEKYEFDFDNKVVKFENTSGTKELTFEKLEEYCRLCKNENRINKPTIILLYSDLKNNKSKNWEFAKVK